MKPVASPLISALLLALCCLACPQKNEKEPPPSVAKEEEPNNEAGQAQKIVRDLTLEADISVDTQPRDEDWFELPASPNHWAYIEATPSPGVDLALELMSPEGDVLLRRNQTGFGGVESIPNVGLAQPRFFRVVSAKDGSGGSYRLSVRFVEAVPEHEAEPNNRLLEAILVPLQQWQQGTLDSAEDVDWFRFEIPLLEPTEPVPSTPREAEAKPAHETAPSPVPTTEPVPTAEPVPAAEVVLRRIAVEVETDAEVAFEIQLCDGEGKPLVQTRRGHRGNWVVRNYALSPNLSALTLVLRPEKRLPNKAYQPPFAPIPYKLKLSLEKEGLSFEAEPNNTPLQATPLPLAREMEALLSPAADVDYFRVDVASPSLINVELSALEGVDLQLSAIVPANTATQEAERLLLRSNEGKMNEAERLLDVECEATCYFKVESVAQKISGKWTKTQENLKTPYKIRAQLQEGLQRREKEPNNAFKQATELALGQNVRGHIYPKGDVDFFRVDLSQHLVRKPILVTLFGLPKNNLGLWLHRLDEEEKLELVQTAPVPKKEGPTTLRYSATPGIYFLEVKDPKKRESNFQDEYQLRIEWDDLP